MRKVDMSRKDAKRISAHFKNMSDDQLEEYVKQNYLGVKISVFAKSYPAVYEIARHRKMIDRLVDHNILKRRRKKDGFYTNMSNETMIAHVKENHLGKTVEELRAGSDGTIYNHLRTRGLLKDIIKRKVLVRKHKFNFFINMNDQALITYIDKNYHGNTIGEFRKKDISAYTVILDRSLVDILIKKSILIREKEPNGFYSDRSDEELMDHVAKNHYGKAITELKNEKGIYHLLRKRKLIDRLVTVGILQRLVGQKRKWSNIEYTYAVASNYLHEHRLEKLPSCLILTRQGYGGLAAAIQRYHGGFLSFNEQLSQYTGKISDKQQLESLLRGYLGEKNER